MVIIPGVLRGHPEMRDIVKFVGGVGTMSFSRRHRADIWSTKKRLLR